MKLKVGLRVKLTNGDEGMLFEKKAGSKWIVALYKDGGEGALVDVKNVAEVFEHVPIKVDDRVRLRAFENNPEETGQVLSVDKRSDTCVVELDPAFQDNPDDDRMRELTLDQIKEVL